MEGRVFLDALYWLSPCNLSELSKTWLNEDLKEIFPYNANTEDIILNKDSRFGNLSIEHFSEKVSVMEEDIGGLL